jgi:DNA (cytosine-5)-methyltransferase 1
MNYKAILDEAWQQHLKPKELNAPTIISLFAGAGGSSLGYSMAGYRELLAVEWDDNAVETFKLNFPDVPVYHGDIAKLSVEECMKLAGLSKSEELDLLDGSPPCQGLSMAGKRNINDPRNQLFREYVRLLRGLRPKVFVMENVSGLVKGKMKLVFAEIMKELKASGYKVSARLMNTMYFYVPQSRERIIFIGVREDLEIEPKYPKAENRPITVKEAWKNVCIGNVQVVSLSTDSALAKYYHKVPNGKNFAVVAGMGFNVNKLDWNTPCSTIIRLGWGINSWSGNIHPNDFRKITIPELLRLSSFPDLFSFGNDNTFNTWKEAYERIGNSVPPLFMRSIANHIKQEILV